MPPVGKLPKSSDLDRDVNQRRLLNFVQQPGRLYTNFPATLNLVNSGERSLVDSYQGCSLCVYSTYIHDTSSHTDSKGVGNRRGLFSRLFMDPTAAPTQAVIYPLNLLSVQWQEKWA